VRSGRSRSRAFAPLRQVKVEVEVKIKGEIDQSINHQIVRGVEKGSKVVFTVVDVVEGVGAVNVVGVVSINVPRGIFQRLTMRQKHAKYCS
jgi:hypothetical protein